MRVLIGIKWQKVRGCLLDIFMRTIIEQETNAILLLDYRNKIND